ncbi:hypothetical protein L1987_24503 [Smallanthus sonchifolius]|uniref:Uncharacterized protein n=1 Tax=Smallanthus sonchifolius TaxID=185202 RepID=A0ACB9IMD8_9ASTR|nr:hypothetical protein L1987_24503 [Smallanthus sonchifolius]
MKAAAVSFCRRLLAGDGCDGCACAREPTTATKDFRLRSEVLSVKQFAVDLQKPKIVQVTMDLYVPLIKFGQSPAETLAMDYHRGAEVEAESSTHMVLESALMMGGSLVTLLLRLPSMPNGKSTNTVLSALD